MSHGAGLREWADNKMLRLINQIIGTIVLVAGLILFPMPIPFGALLIAIGSFILIGSSPLFVSVLRGIRRKFPKFNQAFTSFSSKMPEAIHKQLSKTDPETPSIGND